MRQQPGIFDVGAVHHLAEQQRHELRQRPRHLAGQRRQPLEQFPEHRIPAGASRRTERADDHRSRHLPLRRHDRDHEFSGSGVAGVHERRAVLAEPVGKEVRIVEHALRHPVRQLLDAAAEFAAVIRRGTRQIRLRQQLFAADFPDASGTRQRRQRAEPPDQVLHGIFKFYHDTIVSKPQNSTFLIKYSRLPI